MKSLTKILTAAAGLMLALPFTSCVNEWPHPEYKTYAVTLDVHSETTWLPDYYMTYTRQPGAEVEYIFKIFNAGTTTQPISEFTVYKADLNRNDFSVDVALNPGNYDIYVWSDLSDSSTGKSLFYDTSNFASISYLKPYRGDTDEKDAFRGMISLQIDETMYLEPTAHYTINLNRPLARYKFIATDVQDYINDETVQDKMRSYLNSRGTDADIDDTKANDNETRNRVSDYLSSYTVKVIYPLYMPAVFDNFKNQPIDSWTNVSFTGGITMLSDDEAAIGMDYVMVVGQESAVQVMLEIYDENNVMVSRTNTIKLPIARDRTTIVSGRFLTSLESGGVAIDPDFEGSYDIPYDN